MAETQPDRAGGAPRGIHASGFGAHSPAARRRQVIDHILLALRSSEVARVIDVGTLSYYLDAAYGELARGGSLQTQALWNALAAEPGIEPKMLQPPFLAIKAWETKVGMRVTLPAELDRLTETERQLHLARCPVQLKDVDRLLGRVPPSRAAAAPAATSPRPPTGVKLSAAYADPAAALRDAQQQKTAPAAAPRKPKGPPSRAQKIGAAIAASVGAVAVVVSIFLTLYEPADIDIDVGPLRPIGPVLSARRSGTAGVLTMSSDFARLSRAEQTDVARRLAANLSAHGVVQVVLVDPAGTLLLTLADRGAMKERAAR